MARKPQQTENTAVVVTDADTPGLPAMRDAANQLIVMESEQDATVRAVAAKIGYQLPANCTDPDLIQRDIAANMRRSVEACLEVGRGLRVLKEACGHGQFAPRLEVLGLDASVAIRFMQAATKFSNAATSQHLTKAIGSQSKLFEMLVLDDEQIDELHMTGQTGELKLDDIATMSVKELRAALRETRENAEARSRLLEDKNQHIDRLTEKLAKEQKRVKAMPPTDIGEQIRVEAAQAFSLAEVELLSLRAPLVALTEHAEQHGVTHSEFIAGLMCQLELAMAKLRGEFDIKTAPNGDERPEWLRPGALESVNAQVAASMETAGWTVDGSGQPVPPAWNAN